MAKSLLEILALLINKRHNELAFIETSVMDTVDRESDRNGVQSSSNTSSNVFFTNNAGSSEDPFNSTDSDDESTISTSTLLEVDEHDSIPDVGVMQ